MITQKWRSNRSTHVDLNVMKNDHAQIIKDRLTKALTDLGSGLQILADFSLTFSELGLPPEEALTVAKTVVRHIEQSETMKDAEIKVRKLLEETKVRDGNLIQA